MRRRRCSTHIFVELNVHGDCEHCMALIEQRDGSADWSTAEDSEPDLRAYERSLEAGS